jgi:uncharacterized protein (UPF0264 family)
VSEVDACIKGGAAIIDVKEPSRGPLGRADDEILLGTVERVAERLPVSAALGELTEYRGGESAIPEGLRYVKLGLAGCILQSNWRSQLIDVRRRIEARHRTTLVAVGYADWKSAESPEIDQVVELAIEFGFPILLIDTWRKHGKTLLDWLSQDDVTRVCETARRAGIKVALAGSLDWPQINQLLPAKPEWFGVRGAVCVNGQRGASIDANRVKRLTEALASATNTKESSSCARP